jgi:hypothetical protein
VLLPIIGTLIRASASLDDDTSPRNMGLRSWRAAREDIKPVSSTEPDGESPVPSETLRVTVPTDVAEVLEATLAGLPPRSCGRCQATCIRSRIHRVRAWCGCWVLVGLSTGYFSLVFTNSLDDDVPQLWSTVGFSASVAYVAVGVICATSTFEMARIISAMAPGVSGQDEQPAPHLDAGLLDPDGADSQERSEVQENPSQLFLKKLLASEISETASQVSIFPSKARSRTREANLLAAGTTSQFCNESRRSWQSRFAVPWVRPYFFP